MKTENWERLIPDRFRDSAYERDGEYAWPRDEALQVLAVLNEHHCHILGVDVWVPTRPGPSPVIYDWDETRTGVRPNFPKDPADFIRFFTYEMGSVFDQPLPPHFNLTVE